jgi:hypothetical protein
MNKYIILFMSFFCLASAEDFKLRPFFTDGCSGILDTDYVFTGESYVDCCIVHDIAYWKGGTLEEKAKADKDFGICISERVNPLIGSLFEQGVRYGGSDKLDLPWRWGYGWYPKRLAGPLNESDLHQVEKLIPRSSEDLVIPGELNEAKPQKFHPSLTGNACLDSIYSYISPMNMFVTITMIEVENVESGSLAAVSIESCEGTVDFHFSASIEECAQRHRVEVEKPNYLVQILDATKNCKGLSGYQLQQGLKK